jgi:hypothetical protein
MKKAFFALAAAISILAAVFVGKTIPQSDIDPQKLIQASVVVMTPGGGSGSGVVFRNGNQSFVWTNAHVVASTKSVKHLVDPLTGEKKRYEKFADVKLSQETVSKGRVTGSTFQNAKVIRFNEEIDVALLMVYEEGWPEQGTTFVKRLPKEGEEIWHVGAPCGPQNANSLLPGTIAKVGRLQENVLWDHVTTQGFWGCSGGGMFLKHSGECVGIMSRFAGVYQGNMTFGNFYIVPARSIVDFAWRVTVPFAVTTDVEVPSIDKIMAFPISDEPYVEVIEVAPRHPGFPFP